MAYRVIQWGAGRNGQALIRAVARHPDLELAGCRVWSPDKDGVDAGVLAGGAPLGVAATTDRDALIALDADVVLFCPNLRPDMSQSDQDICDLLRSGKNVISVSGAHSMPSGISDAYARRFEEACRQGGVTFAAAGINPGFIAERLAPTMTGMCADVESVAVRETYLCAAGGADILFETMGFGLPIDEWTADSPVARMFNHLFQQLIHNMAHSLGVELAEVRWTASVAPAHRDIELPAGLIRAGTVGAINQIWEGVPKDPKQIRVSKQTSWVVAEDIPGFPVKSGWQIHVQGKPNVVTEVRLEPDANGDFHEGEAMVGGAVSVIPEVVAAPPGFLLPSIFAPFKRRFQNADRHGA